ncbi:MAG: GTP cyclohydrolase I FolE [Candidatus Sumerlaeia bacterium]
MAESRTCDNQFHGEFDNALETSIKDDLFPILAQDDPIMGLTHQLLRSIGENPERDGLLRTPERVARAWRYLTAGYQADVDEVVNQAVFDEPALDEMVIVRDIEFYSLCEHHLLPFYGVAHVAYMPRGKIIGLSKIPRLVDVFARRLQVQERMTMQIAESLMRVLQPHGVAVVTEAHHLCMMMRGVQKQNSSTLSSAMLGSFRDNLNTRNEFLMNIASRYK